ncbi:MAG: hypothetical protein LBH25_06990 [Fibromonadaceae bacterium]|jgi:hypothetical protein|nr:hypothetical protein [Fibromonadaceae bacterium]
MSKKTLFPFLLTAAAIAFLAGCKGTNESNGDKYLKEGKYRNAVNSYTNALQKGKVSKEFYDNLVIAYVSAAKQIAKKNASDDIIRSYAEQIFKNIPNVKGKAAIDSAVQGLTEIGVAQVSGNFEYEYTLQGFRNLDSAVNIAKRSGVSTGPIEAARKKAEDALVKVAVESAEGAANAIAAEYVLLEAEVLAPKSEDLQKELNKVRMKNRGTYLVFAEEIIGQKPSRLVDKYGYVISFPILSITPTGTTGEIAIWNATGNNMDFDINKLKMVSADGKEVMAKYTGGGWCFMSDHEGKKKSQFKGSVGKLLSENQCQAKVSFSYSGGFVPDYVDIKDQDNNIGRKYFGYSKK